MATIVTRAGKGTELTKDEVDANFNNLNSTKLENGYNAILNTVSIQAINVNSGAINGTAIGLGTPDIGNFSEANIYSGVIDNTAIGSTTPSTGAFTNLTATGTVTLNGTTISAGLATITGGIYTLVDINNGNIDGTAIGVTTPDVGIFSNLSAAGEFTSQGIDDNATGPQVTVTDTGVGVGTASPYSEITLSASVNGDGNSMISWDQAGESIQNIFPVRGGSQLLLARGFKSSGTVSNAFESSYSTATQRAGVSVATDGVRFYADPSATIAEGAAYTPTLRALLDVNGNLNLEGGNGDGRGITFGSTTAVAAQTLDYYEEGTFTPAFEPSTGAFGSITYGGNTSGRYTRIGNRVFCDIHIDVDSLTIGTASGLLKLIGLPFSAAAYGSARSVATVGIVAGNWTEWPTNGDIPASAAYMFLRTVKESAATSILNASGLGSTSTITLSVVYEAA